MARTKWLRLAFEFAILLTAAPCFGAINHVQQASNSDVSGAGHTSFSATFPFATTSGNAIVVGVTFGNINPTITVTDSQGNTYVQAIQTYDSGHSQGAAIFYSLNITGGTSNTVTLQFSGAVSYLALGIHEYSGMATVSAIDGTAGSLGNGPTVSSSSLTTTTNGDLVFSVGVEDSVGSGDTFTAGSGFTKRVDLGSAAAYADEDQIQTSAGSIAGTWTLSPTSLDWIALAAAFKASAISGPTITSLSPLYGPVGTPVTITGTNFGATQGSSTVTFNGTQATPTSWSGTSIVVPVPSGATSGNVVVTVSGAASNVNGFIVGNIRHVQQASNGDESGLGYTSFSATFGSPTTGGNAVVFGLAYGLNVSTITATDSQGNSYTQAIHTFDPRHSEGCAIFYATNIVGGTSNTVTVSFGGATVAYLTLGIHEYAGLAASSALDGTSGATGSGSAVSSGSTTTTANGDLIFSCGVEDSYSGGDTYTPGLGFTKRVDLGMATGYADEDRLQASAGSIAGTWTLSPDFRDWIADVAAFMPASGGSTTPSITSLSPTVGGVGTSVTITGTNFGSSQGTSTVTFNGTVATPCPTCWSATSITVSVPSGATTGNVVVTVAGVASNGVSFTVVSPPTITSFTPTSAAIGTLISVTGTNFTANNATPTVTLSQQGGGTLPAPVSSFSSTSVSFVIPTGAATGNITVTANGMNAVSSTSLTITAASSFTVSATPGTATLLPGQTTTYQVSLSSTNGFSQLTGLAVSGLPSGVTGTFVPPQISPGQFSILTLTAPSGQGTSSNTLTITGTAIIQGITQNSSQNVTLQVQGTSGVAFAGRVAVTDPYDTPLPGVTVRMLGLNATGGSTGCTGTGTFTTTDASGNFVLNGVPAACVGGQLIEYDTSTVSASLGKYSGVRLSYQLTSGQVTTPGAGFIVHLPRVDNAETFSVQNPSSVDQTFVSRSIPGVTITVYAGTTLSLANNGGSPNPFPFSIVEIPYDRLPEQVVPDFTKDPVFAMSIEPYNSSSSQPVAVSFPNRAKLPPGTNMQLTSLNPTLGMMQPYGNGTVSADGTQVVPDFDSAHPGHRYGISHFDWHFPLNGSNPTNPSMAGLTAGDPVDLASGLPVITKTDIVLGGARGQIGITRTFRGATTNPGPFGIGTNHNYGYILDTTNAWGGLINLILPDGNQIPFVQPGGGTGAVAAYSNTTWPSAQGAVLSTVLCTFGSGCSATLRWKNGTTFQFQPFPLQLPTVSFLMSITDSNGNKTTLARNPNSTISQVIDPAGRALSLGYDTNRPPRITSISDPIGRTVQYVYDTPCGTGHLCQVKDVNTPAGVTNYTYTDPNAPNSPSSITDARGIQYLTNTYDTATYGTAKSGRVIQQQTVDGAIWKFAYTQANSALATSPVLLTTVTDPMGNKTTYHFNPAGYLLDVTDALGRKTVYNRDPATNLLQSVTDPLGRITAFTYDSNGNPLMIKRLAGTTSAVTTTMTYDPAFNKLTSVTDPLGTGHTTTFSYDKAGNLTQVTDPVDPPANLAYDGAGELVSATDPLGNTATLAYDGFGNLTQFKDPLLRTLSRVTDAVGRTQSITNPLGQTVKYQFSPLNQITQITDPLNGQTYMTYDPNGNLLTLVDPLGSTHTTTYTYDNMDRVLTRTDPLGHMECYGAVSGSTCQSGTGYDLNGNLIKFTDRRGKVTTFQYDAVNRRTSASFGPGESTITYSYDAADRLVQVTDSTSGTITRAYDNLDRLFSEVTPQGSVSYAYDNAGRRTSMTVSGQPTIIYGYDNANRLTSVTQGSATVTIVPDADGRRQSVTLPNGVKMAYDVYDAASQLKSITYTQGSTTLGTLTYSYDASGRRTGVGGTFARTGVPRAASPASYNANNQLTNWKGATLTYDANGNLTGDGTNTYTWNARNQLVAISGGASASFQYDPFGRRVSKTIGGTTQYLYDGANPVQEISGGSASANLLTGGLDEYFQRTDSAGTRSFLTDALGSTLALADSTGTVQTSYTFEPFGNTTTAGATTTNSFAFTGRELDSTGLYFYRARYHHPTLQRFISEDPIELLAPTANLYPYVLNNPTNWTDPSGLYTIQIGLKLSGVLPIGPIGIPIMVSTGIAIDTHGNIAAINTNTLVPGLAEGAGLTAGGFVGVSNATSVCGLTGPFLDISGTGGASGLSGTADFATGHDARGRIVDVGGATLGFGGGAGASVQVTETAVTPLIGRKTKTGCK